jgi:glutamate synthase domain-containing protein 3
VAEDVRRHLARLGYRSVEDAIGQVESLQPKRLGEARADSFDVTPLITPPDDSESARRFVAGVPLQRPRSQLGDQLMAEAFHAVWDGDEVELSYSIANGDRTVGAALGGAIALEWGERPPRGTAVVRFDGEAGQSFGAFLTHGIELELVGEANDYVGKAMSGGRIVVRPPANDAGDPVLAGNTCLYGATGGSLFVAGSVGERFGVRNSGATAVVEGAGDHVCEYMTGGTVVVLGPVGYNVGAGMTGGDAFIWDPHANLTARLNTALVEAVRPEAEDVIELRWLVERHLELTQSPRAKEVLDDWTAFVEQVWHVVPLDRVRRIESQQAGRVGAAV